jgi:hypothetical protein
MYRHSSLRASHRRRRKRNVAKRNLPTCTSLWIFIYICRQIILGCIPLSASWCELRGTLHFITCTDREVHKTWLFMQVNEQLSSILHAPSFVLTCIDTNAHKNMNICIINIRKNDICTHKISWHYFNIYFFPLYRHIISIISPSYFSFKVLVGLLHRSTMSDTIVYFTYIKRNTINKRKWRVI